MIPAAAIGALVCLVMAAFLALLLGGAFLRYRSDAGGPVAVGKSLGFVERKFPPDPKAWYVGERRGRQVAIAYVIDDIGIRRSRPMTGGMLRAVVATRATVEKPARAWPGDGPASGRPDRLMAGPLPAPLATVEGYGVGIAAAEKCRFGTVPPGFEAGLPSLLWVEAADRSDDPVVGATLVDLAVRLAEAVE